MIKLIGVAQDLVEATSRLVGGRTINIMDTNGIIVASTEKDRIGILHGGAAEVAATGHVVRIRPEDVGKYKGARPGYNMPIRLGDRIVGTVGVKGEPEEVKEIANLLEVYVNQYVQQQTLLRQYHVESEIRTQLLKQLIVYDRKQDDIKYLCNLIGISVKWPVRSIVFDLGDSKTELFSKLKQFGKLEQYLVENDLLDKSSDIYGIVDNRFVVIKCVSRKVERQEQCIETLYESSCCSQKLSVRISVGEACENIEGIVISYKQAVAMDKSGGCPINDINKNSIRRQYLLHKMLESDVIDIVEKMYKDITAAHGESDAQMMLKSIKTYYDENGSITKAAEKLFVHKNTLLYRIKKLYESLNFKNESDFTKELLVRLIIEAYLIK